MILMYHRVSDLACDPWSRAVAPDRFAEQLAVLRDHAQDLQVCRLTDLASPGRPQRQVVITFDDGYADNLFEARPLLERYDCPATVFLVSGDIDGTREFWWDELSQIFLEPNTLPESLDLMVEGVNHRWHLAAD